MSPDPPDLYKGAPHHTLPAQGMGLEQRRRQLREGWGFTCCCRRCQVEEAGDPYISATARDEGGGATEAGEPTAEEFCFVFPWTTLGVTACSFH